MEFKFIEHLMPASLKRFNFMKLPLKLREGVALLLLGVISWLDFITPDYIFLTGFYLLPIWLAIWYCSKPVTLLVVVVSMANSLYMTKVDIPAGVTPWHLMIAFLSVVIVIMGFVALIFNLKVMFDRLHVESQTDALTGLRNRRSFIDVAHFEISRAQRTGDSITLSLLDLDNFKQINDTQGHAAGDALLVAASRCMTANLREVDIVARLGGDEFVILLPGANAELAREILFRLQSSLKSLLQSFSHTMTASIGAVTVPPGVLSSVADVIDRADVLMYSVKHSSKDGVVIEVYS